MVRTEAEPSGDRLTSPVALVQLSNKQMAGSSMIFDLALTRRCVSSLFMSHNFAYSVLDEKYDLLCGCGFSKSGNFTLAYW